MALISTLERIAGADHVLTHAHQLRTYESDGLTQYAALPRAVVLPGTAEEVRDVVAACHAGGRAVGGARLGLRACPAARCRWRRAC